MAVSWANFLNSRLVSAVVYSSSTLVLCSKTTCVLFSSRSTLLKVAHFSLRVRLHSSDLLLEGLKLFAFCFLFPVRHLYHQLKHMFLYAAPPHNKQTNKQQPLTPPDRPENPQPPPRQEPPNPATTPPCTSEPAGSVRDVTPRRSLTWDVPGDGSCTATQQDNATTRHHANPAR